MTAWMHTLARHLYGLAMTLAQPLLRAKLARRGRAEPGYLEAIPERFGHYTSAAQPDAVWVHAVSLGETRTAGILLTQLRGQYPGMRLLLTHGTATGRLEGEGLLQAGDQQAWLPWDAPGAVGRFLDHFRPRIGVLMETEVWPILVAQCHARGLPLVLVNARLSEKSLRGAQRLSLLSRAAYGALAAVWAQTEADAQRLRQLGAPVQGVLGNIKFDAKPDAVLLAQGRAWRAELGAPVVMFASSRDGEEVEFLREAMARYPAVATVRWLLVPRHPQRFDTVAALATSMGWRVSRRSTWDKGGPPSQLHAALKAMTATSPATAEDPGDHKPELWLGDSLGEMALYYGLSDVALLGGSFAPLGGQNLIEAAACGCPVVMGPHTFNFAEAASLAAKAGAAQEVNDIEAAVALAVDWAAEPAQLSRLQSLAADFAASHKGAAQRTADAVGGVLSRVDERAAESRRV
jgi:3-deoxy-D-manno-octulosonic-acid transferase